MSAVKGVCVRLKVTVDGGPEKGLRRGTGAGMLVVCSRIYCVELVRWKHYLQQLALRLSMVRFVLFSFLYLLLCFF